jgi:ribonuclease D
MDTHHLLELAARLEAMLQEQNRTGWHQQMCRRSVRAAVNHKPDIDPERDWRIKGSSLLNRRQLAFLKQLWLWREKQAQKADLPPFRILHNERLIDLAIQADSHANPDFSILLGRLNTAKADAWIVLSSPPESLRDGVR